MIILDVFISKDVWGQFQELHSCKKMRTELYEFVILGLHEKLRKFLRAKTWVSANNIIFFYILFWLLTFLVKKMHTREISINSFANFAQIA